MFTLPHFELFSVGVDFTGSTRHIVAITVLLLVIVLYQQWSSCRDQLRMEAESLVSQFTNEVEELEVESPACIHAAHAAKNRLYTPVCVLAVQEARTIYGVVNDNRANRLVVSKFIRDWMRERGMRPSHIVKYSVIAIELFFVPTPSEHLAVHLQSIARRERAMLGRPTASR
jgi:hypothetical protein